MTLVVADAHGRQVRDPSAATQQVVYQTPGWPQTIEWDAEQAITFGYYANVYVYRCVQIRATTFSRVPFRVGADPSKPQDHDPNHPLARLLSPPPGGPNPATSARSLWAWTLAQYLVTGRLCWELELGAAGQVVALWPLAAPYLKPIATTGGSAYFRAFEFGRSGEERTLPAERAFYHWRPKADDWRQPESVLQAARLDVSVAVMQDRYDYAFLRNDARPASVVVTRPFASEADERAFKYAWNSDYRGPENAGKTAFTSTDAENVAGSVVIETLGLSQRDAEFIKRYDAKLRAICVAFGTPLSKLGDASGRTFSNASEENRNWWEDTILPDLDDIADAVNIRFAGMLGPNVGFFDTSGVPALAPRRVSSDTDVARLTQSYVMTINEARAELHLPPVPDGDRFLTAEEIQALKASGPGATAGAAVGAPGLAREAPPAAQGATEPALPEPAPATPVPAPAPVRDVQRRAVQVIAAATSVEVLEHTWERTFRRLFARQEAATLARLQGKRARQAARAQRETANEIFDARFWRDKTEDESRVLYEQVVGAAGTQVATTFGVTFSLEAPRVQRYIEQRAKDLAGQVTDTTYEAIRQELVEGMQAGEGIPDLAKRIRRVFAHADTVRSVTIARTETISAYNGAAVSVAGDTSAAVLAGQEWVATGDHRTRPAHVEADGQVVPIGQPFAVGGDALQYPGDPAGRAGNTINCRCTVAFLTPEEMAARTVWVAHQHARAVLALVPPGPFDGRQVRAALELVATA